MSSINLDYGSIRSLTTDVSNLTDTVNTLDTKITDSGLMGFGFNTALGLNSLPNTGSYIASNTAIGYNVMNSIVVPNASSNTIIGGNAFSSGLGGSGNTIIGANSGSSLLFSEANTIIGANINFSNTEISNQIAIGPGDGTSRATFNGTNWIFSSIPPISASSSGSTGEIAFDTSFIYYCINTNTWTRTGLNSW